MAAQDKPPSEKTDREAKLAQALRANLRRRKAERSEGPPKPAKEESS